MQPHRAARATGPSLGTVIAASFFVALFSTLATLLRSLRRLLTSSHLPSILRPFLVTWLAPLLASLASYAAFFNSYSLSYAGMTGEGFWTASRETAELFRVNRARNIRDSESPPPLRDDGTYFVFTLHSDRAPYPRGQPPSCA